MSYTRNSKNSEIWKPKKPVDFKLKNFAPQRALCHLLGCMELPQKVLLFTLRRGFSQDLARKMSRYTFEEDMAIVNYMTTDKRYLQASGIQVWKDAEKLMICPGRPYLSLKERYRKVIVKNLKKYNVDAELALKIIQFSRATSDGKRTIRLKQSSAS